MIAILTGISLLIFLTMCALAVFKPHWAIVLIFSLFAYEQLLSSYITLLGQKTWLLNVVVGVISMISLTMLYVYGKRPFQNGLNPNSVLIASLFVFAYFGYTYSRIPPAALYFIKTGFPYAVLMLVILPSLVTSQEQIKKMCLPLLIIGCSLIALILISPRTQYYGMRLFIDLSYTHGGESRGNPLAIAEFGGLIVIVAALMGRPNQGMMVRLIRIASIFLGLSICFLAAARGQLIFAIFFSVLLYPVAYEIKNIGQFFIRASSIGAVAGIMLVIAKMFLFKTDSSQRFGSSEISDGISGRMQMATTMIGEYLANPANYLQGLGTGSYNAIVMSKGDNYLYPHNIVIEVLTHHGLIGFSILMGIFGITGYHTIKLLRMMQEGLVDRGSVAIVIALSGYWTLISLKQGSFLIIPVPFYMYLITSKMYLRQRSEIGVHEYEEEDCYDYPGDQYDDS